MQKGQEMFLHFFLERTVEGKQEEAKALLVQSFADQATKAMTMADFAALKTKLTPLIQPEKLGEVEEAMAHFSKNL